MQGHRARKRFGQHFLSDRHYLARIVAAIDPQPGDNMLEIGPGLGALTAPLLEHLAHLHAVEIDRDLAARLRESFPPERLTVHECDALDFDLAQLPAPLRVVGNLPYNISSPLLFHIAGFADRVSDCIFMLQREVVDRMVAPPDGDDYGRLSVMLQYRFAMEKVLSVPPGAFTPPPKVDSAVVRMVPLPAGRARARDDKRFAAVVAAAFSQRRKMLRNTLKGLVAPGVFGELGIAPTARAETLGVAQFIALADAAA